MIAVVRGAGRVSWVGRGMSTRASSLAEALESRKTVESLVVRDKDDVTCNNFMCEKFGKVRLAKARRHSSRESVRVDGSVLIHRCAGMRLQSGAHSEQVSGAEGS